MELDNKRISEVLESFRDGITQQVAEGTTMRAIVVFSFGEDSGGGSVVGSLGVGEGRYIHAAIAQGVEQLASRMERAVRSPDGTLRDTPEHGGGLH